MNTSHTFGTIRRDKIIEDLQNVLKPGGLHMVRILLKDLSLTVITERGGGKFHLQYRHSTRGLCEPNTLHTVPSQITTVRNYQRTTKDQYSTAASYTTQ